MQQRILLLLLSVLLFSPIPFANADLIAIDLRGFYVDPSVTVATDGNSANMTEDPSLITVLLSNDPFLGDPG